MFAAVHGLTLMAWFSPGKPVNRSLCQAATNPGDIYLPREIPFQDVVRAVHLGIDCTIPVFDLFDVLNGVSTMIVENVASVCIADKRGGKAMNTVLSSVPDVLPTAEQPSLTIIPDKWTIVHFKLKQSLICFFATNASYLRSKGRCFTARMINLHRTCSPSWTPPEDEKVGRKNYSRMRNGNTTIRPVQHRVSEHTRCGKKDRCTIVAVARVAPNCFLC